MCRPLSGLVKFCWRSREKEFAVEKSASPRCVPIWVQLYVSMMNGDFREVGTDSTLSWIELLYCLGDTSSYGEKLYGRTASRWCARWKTGKHKSVADEAGINENWELLDISFGLAWIGQGDELYLSAVGRNYTMERKFYFHAGDSDD